MPIYTAAEIMQLMESRKTILNIGPPFTGKTRSLWTLVKLLKERKLGPLHHIDLDQKCESLVEMLREQNLLDYIVIHRLKALDQLGAGAQKVAANRAWFDDFMSQFNSFWQQVNPSTGGWKNGFQCGAIFIDSLTKYNEIITEFVVSVTGHDLGAAGTDARNDYTKIMNKVKDTIDSLKALPCITGWIAHEQIVQSEFDGKIVLLPNMVGKNTMAPSIGKEFNCLLFSLAQEDPASKKIKYVWQVQPGGWVRSAGVTGKSNLPQFIDQDYSLIL